MSDPSETDPTARVAVLLMAYGTPRSPDAIEAYYTEIRHGRPPSPVQLADLVARYAAIGGVSPLAQRTESQRDALQRSLDRLGEYHVAIGLKHAEPKIETAVDELAAMGFTRVVAAVLAPHYSAASVGQYLDRAASAAARHHIDVVGLESWATEPAFVDFLASDLRRRLSAMPSNTKVVFTAHSLPARVVAGGDPYPEQLFATAAAVAAAASLGEWSGWAVAWQSAGRTREAWIGPDILAVIDDLAASEAADGLLVCACGFVADHLEVLYDLDIEARRRAESLGLAFDRTTCVNDDPAVIDALAALIHQLAGR
ncbi:MAG: ferrochelatase [Ilumatobacteraceae bacterium]